MHDLCPHIVRLLNAEVAMCVVRARFLWTVLLAVIVLAAPPAYAGRAAQILGTITDETGGPISGAQVTVTGPGVVGIRSVRTDIQGRYRIIAVDADLPLEVLTEADGKVAVEYHEYQIRPGRVNHLDLRLRSQGTHDILVLMDRRVPYHQLALDGARSTLPGRLRLVEVGEATPSSGREILRALAEHPSAVLAIGEEAARAARVYVNEIPVVHCMVPDPLADRVVAESQCGISLVGGFDHQIERLARLDPGIRRVGILYDPSRLGHAVSRFRLAAEAAGISLVAGYVRRTEDFPRALDDLSREKLDAFVVLMDPDVYTARNFALVRRFTTEKDIVLVVPDSSMTGPGKIFTLTPGFWETGAVAGMLLRQIVEGRLKPIDVGIRDPTEGEVAAARAAAALTGEWRPAPGGELPLIGAVATAARLREAPGEGDLQPQRE
jgi:putative ABC transport system substrate-binding protein